MKTNRNLWAVFLGMFAAASLVLASCSPSPTAAPTSTTAVPLIPSAIHTSTAPPSISAAPTSTAAVTRIPSATLASAATPIPLPAYSLQPGQLYFSVDGKPGFFYSRNVAVNYLPEFHTLMDWSAAGGTRMIRFGLINYVGMGGYPYTNTGELNEPVLKNWESVLDDAATHGLFICPWFTGGSSTDQKEWAGNPLNAANGGPAKKPAEVFQEGTPANRMWFEFVNRLVTRWKDRPNILCWEVLGEANMLTGVTEQQAIAFAEKMAQVIRATDPHQRPITASLADNGTWLDFYNSKAIDFIQTHPYPIDRKLDRTLVDFVHRLLARYHKPVMDGESGFNFDPMTNPNWITASPKAHIGIQHAIWAGVVSGVMNGRALFWEDAYGIYFPSLRSVWLNKYSEVERPAARFTNGVDFTDFQPLTVRYQDGARIWGASVGSDHMALGWFRDAGSEPPNWPLLPSLHGQAVTLAIPGSVQDWQVDFYDTKTGNALGGSALLTRQGDHVTVALPDFADDIAFKLHANTTGAIISPPPAASVPAPILLNSTDPAAGKWEGSLYGETSDFAAVLNVIIQPGCKVGSICGKSATDFCSIDLVLNKIEGSSMVFDEKNASGTSTCPAGGIDHLTLQPDGTILFRFEPGATGLSVSNGILHRK